MIRGNANTRVVTLNGEPLDPQRSQTLINHSPDGFSWGYGGSGPAQLALAILLEYADEKFALANYQQFKFDMLTGMLMHEHLVIAGRDIRAWIEKVKGTNKEGN